MTEELLNIFEQNRKTPLEDRLNRTIDSFENMFSLFLEVTDIIDNKLNSLQEQINSLETRFIALEQGRTKNRINPIASPPSPVPNWFFNSEIPKKLFERLREKLSDLNCPYCDSKLRDSLPQRVSKKDSIKCKYCYTTLAKIT